eukprot:gene31600-38189_t
MALGAATDLSAKAKAMADKLSFARIEAFNQKSLEKLGATNLRGSDNAELEEVKVQDAGRQFVTMAAYDKSDCTGQIVIFMTLAIGVCQEVGGRGSYRVMYNGMDGEDILLTQEFYGNRNCRGAPFDSDSGFGGMSSVCSADDGPFGGVKASLVAELPSRQAFAAGVRMTVYDDKKACQGDQTTYAFNPPEDYIEEMMFMAEGVRFSPGGDRTMQLADCWRNEDETEHFKMKIYNDEDFERHGRDFKVMERDTSDFCNRRSDTAIGFFRGHVSWSCVLPANNAG